MQTTQKSILKRILAPFLALCVLCTYGGLFSLKASAAETRDFNTPEGLAAGHLWHYNGILFGDWSATQADIEGAIAVAGNVDLSLISGQAFSIGANGDKLVMGDYDPTSDGYPTALFGAKAGQHTIDIGSNVTAFGHLVQRESNGTAYDAQLAKINQSKGSLHKVDDTAVDSLFATARSYTDTLIDTLSGASNGAAIDATVCTGWSGSLPADPAQYEAANIGYNNVLVVPIEGDSLQWDDLSMSGDWARYDVIVLYFKDVTTATFTSATSITVDGVEVFSPTADHRLSADPANDPAIQRNIEWTQRMVSVFPKAQTINITGAVVGSVIAPNAVVNGGTDTTAGNINGMLIANSLHQKGSFELHSYWISPLIFDVIDPDPGPEPEPEPDTINVQLVKLDRADWEQSLAASFTLQWYQGGSWSDYYDDNPVDGFQSPFTTPAGQPAKALELPELHYPAAYRLYETTVPTGYDTPTDFYSYFTIDDNGVVTAGEDSSGDTLYDAVHDRLQVFNDKTGEPSPEGVDVQFTKVDAEKGTPLNGAQFTIYTEVFAPVSGDEGLGTTPELEDSKNSQDNSEANSEIEAGGDTAAPLSLALPDTVQEEPEDTERPEEAAIEEEPLPDEPIEGVPDELPADSIEKEILDETEQGKAPQQQNPEEPDTVQNDMLPEQDPMDWYDLEFAGRYWKLLAENVVSDTAGVFFTLQDANPGTVFLIQETAAPDGYLLPEGNDAYTIAVYKQGDNSLAVSLPNTAEDEPGPDPEPDPGIALFYKVSAYDGEGLPGAHFRLEMKNESGDWETLIEKITSITDGEINVGGLLAGEYRLIETDPPDGYLLDEDPIYFTMGLVGDEILMLDGDDNRIDNEPEQEEPQIATPGSIRITKCDADDNDILLPGTVFTLHIYNAEQTTSQATGVLPVAAPTRNSIPAFVYDDDDSHWTPYPDSNSYVHITGDEGMVYITGLVAGVYRIEEVEPPTGYDLWGDGIDVIHFVMVEALDENGNLVTVLDSIYNNHLEADDEVIFADRVTPVSSEDPTTTTSDGIPSQGSESYGESTPGSSSAPNSTAYGTSRYTTGTASYTGGGYNSASRGQSGASAGKAGVQTGDTVLWPWFLGIAIGAIAIGLPLVIVRRRNDRKGR